MDKLLAEIRGAANVIATPNWTSILSAIVATCAVIITTIVAYLQIKILEKQNQISEQQIKISEQQNQIALFRERLTAYEEIVKMHGILELVAGLRDAKVKTALLLLFPMMGYEDVEKTYGPLDSIALHPYLLKTKMILRKIPYIFPGVKNEDVKKLDSSFSLFLSEMVDKMRDKPDIRVRECISKKRCDFSQNHLYFWVRYMKLMEKFLYMA